MNSGTGVIALLCLSLLTPHSALLTVVEAGEWRDPFVFGPSEQYPQRVGQPILTGIVWDAVRPLAVVDGEPVMLGETVAGWQIVEIHPGRIVVQQGTVRDTLEPGALFPQE
jgi:hypothetical protein